MRIIRALVFIITIQAILLSFGCTKIDINSLPDTPQEVWGDLEKHEGGRVWDTLTEKQQALVNYPEFDDDCVYWVPKGKAYHSIDWCYTLNRSKDIRSGTLEEAIERGLFPCSKCVGDQTAAYANQSLSLRHDRHPEPIER